jgi:hypothetical protein
MQVIAELPLGSRHAPTLVIVLLSAPPPMQSLPLL